MKQGIVAFVCCIAVAAWPFSANSQDGGRQWGRFDSVHIDQDLFAPGNQDRNYTMGLRFTWQGKKADRQLLSMFGTLRRMDHALGLEYQDDLEKQDDELEYKDDLEKQDGVYKSVSLGSSAFTPDDLRREDPIRDDRPYASILYTASSVVVPDGNDRAVESKLVVGVLGLRISEWAQTRIHVVNRSRSGKVTPYDPKGWGNQISDGGELTAMYQRSWMRRIPMTSKRFDAAGSCEMYAGYYTGASCGAVLKAGKFDKEGAPFWTMLGDINPQADASGVTSIAPARVSSHAVSVIQPWIEEWYLLLGGRARMVGYNELLQGGFRDTEYVLRSGDIERLVGEASLGFNLTFSRGRRLMFTCTQRSPEHELAQRRSHRWCGINFFRLPL